ncbi:MAG TPA: hypothetical protein VGO60_00075 [Iamia sp.]|nr:hypothetical protein [Iamia sp.]
MVLTVLGVVVLFALVAALAVVMIGTRPEEDAQRFVPVGSSLPDRPRPDEATTTETTTTEDRLMEDEDFPDDATTTVPSLPRWIEGLPPLPDRDHLETPGADPADFCLSATEFGRATGWPVYEGSPPWVQHPVTFTANDVRFTTSACAYLNQGSISRTPDPDGLVLDALRRSRGDDVVVRPTVVTGPDDLVLESQDVVAPRWTTLVFAVGPDTYSVGVVDGPGVECTLVCAQRVAEVVIARVT